MFVQALAEYAQNRLGKQLKDEAWEEKPVPYLLEVASDGTFLTVTERKTEAARGKKTIAVAQMLTVPRSPVNRMSGLHPLLGVADTKYVLGVGAWTKPDKQENPSERHS